MKRQSANQSVVTAGIRRVLIGFIAVGCMLAAVQVFAVTQLQREIDRWAWTSELNGLRESLLTRSSAFLDGNTGVSNDEIIQSFTELSSAILSRPPSEDRQGFASRVAVLVEDARGFFQKAEERRAANLPLVRENLQQVDRLRDLSATWSTQLRAEELRISLLADENDASNRSITDIRSNLTSALLAAQLVQQQIIAVYRLTQSSSPEIAKSSIDALSFSGLPPVCGANETETDGKLCSPNVSRVLVALEQLKQADAGTTAERVRAALWGLESYIRAGQGRLQALAEQSKQSLDEAGVLRQQLADLQNLRNALTRINTILGEVIIVHENSETSIDQLNQADMRMRSLTSQMQLRMTGVLRNSAVVRGDLSFITSSKDMISSRWATIKANAEERGKFMAGFVASMETLSREIEEKAETVRGETTLWVNVYVTNFLILAALLVASILGSMWVAKQRLITPLGRVTGTIIDLAKGELERPVALSERAFGFDELRRALEQLRLEMSERELLIKRNHEQQILIESNVLDLERTNEEMEWLAMHDPLTGLANRRHADLHLANLSKCNESDRGNFCVMQIDIDRFKSVNDALGHAAGDFVLRSVADMLVKNTASAAECYRTGGDEFLVIWSAGLTEKQAQKFANNIIELIKKPIWFNGHRCNVGASIGIAFGADSDGDPMQTVINADLALYNVKQSGRDGFEIFTEELALRATRRNDISDRLLAAIEAEAFQPFYQPQFDAKTRALRGVEVLCRWHDDELGWVSPGEFLTVAEGLNVIAAIDEILLDKVSNDLALLLERGISIPRVSFNITADRLLKSDLAPELSKKIGRYTVVALELLESMSLDNPTESVNWAIDNLKDHGIEIEIDDFGSDRASLAGLMAINPQAMKIDRSIVIPIVDSARHRDLVKKILDIGTALNIEIVAEGVETEEHAALLCKNGCDVLQGFGLAKPLPYEQLVAFHERAVEQPYERQAVNQQ